MNFIPIPQQRLLLNVTAALTAFGPHTHALTRTPGYLDIEHNVNGVWNAILNICYPTNDMDFLINPEAYPLPNNQNGVRADLIVRELNVNPAGPGYIAGRTFMYFEGKGGNNPITLQNLRTQMVNYLDQAIGNLQGRSCWAIGAHGDQVWFWRYTARFVGDNRMVPVTWVNGALHSPHGDAGNLVNAYSIAGGAPGAVGNWPEVQHILQEMSQNYAPF